MELEKTPDTVFDKLKDKGEESPKINEKEIKS